MPSKHPLMWALVFGVLALVLLPLTSLWALCAGLAGHTRPLFALRGKNLDDLLDENETV